MFQSYNNVTEEDKTKTTMDEEREKSCSDDSIISEHISSNSENDRSDQEIEIYSIPANLSRTRDSTGGDDDVSHISQEEKPPLFNSRSNSSSPLNSLGMWVVVLLKFQL